jgi:hypothetical protein
VTGALPYAADVRVLREHRLAEREGANRRRRVAADARELGQVVGPAPLGDDAGGAV